MKNFLFLSALAIAFSGFAQNGPSTSATHGKLTAAHFGNYNLTMLRQINTKLVYAADDGKLKAYPNEKMNYVLSADSAKQLRLRKVITQIANDPVDPSGYFDSLIIFYDQVENFNQSKITYTAGKPTSYCLQSLDFTNYPEVTPKAKDYLFFKWDDVMKYLNPAEANWLRFATDWGKNPSSIDTTFLGNFSRNTHRYLDSLLYHIAVNNSIPTYATDSLDRQLPAKEIQAILNYETTIQLLDDPNDPYSVHDSTVYVITGYEPEARHPLRYNIVWKQTPNGYTYDIQSFSPMFEPYAGGLIVPPQPIAMLKTDDVAKKLTAPMMAYLKDLVQHDVLVKMDINYIDDRFIELRGCR